MKPFLIIVCLIGAAIPTFSASSFADDNKLQQFLNAIDGATPVSTASDLVPNWIAECTTDAMTDARHCEITSYLGGVMLYYAQKNGTPRVCVFSHDFPGRDSAIRVDANKAIVIKGDSCVAGTNLLPQMLKGQSVKVRYYEWPYDYPKDNAGSLVGLSEAIEKMKASW